MSLLGGFITVLGSGTVVALTNRAIQDITISPTNASASYQLTSAGVINTITNTDGTLNRGNWITPTSAAGADYEVRATVDSGALTSGTVDTWLALNTTQTWTLDQTTIGIATCALTIEIRRASSGSVLTTATITLEAEEAA